MAQDNCQALLKRELAAFNKMKANLLEEQAHLLSGTFKEMKAILLKREQIAEEIALNQTLRTPSLLKELAETQDRACQALLSDIRLEVAAINKQLKVNAFLLCKKVEFTQVLLQKSMPKSPKTYDSYGQKVSQYPALNKALINREG